MRTSILSNIPDFLPDELTEMIVADQNFRIERIVSQGQSSPTWYDQDKNEFVFVVTGEAKLQFESRDELIHLRAGDYLIIPAHTRHKVAWTPRVEKTVWLTVHY